MAFAGRVLGTVLLVGVGVATVAAIVAAPTILRRARPFVREGLMRSMKLYEQARSAVTEFAEDAEDLVAEVKNDLSSKSATPSAAPIKDADVAERA